MSEWDQAHDAWEDAERAYLDMISQPKEKTMTNAVVSTLTYFGEDPPGVATFIRPVQVGDDPTRVTRVVQIDMHTFREMGEPDRLRLQIEGMDTRASAQTNEKILSAEAAEDDGD